MWRTRSAPTRWPCWPPATACFYVAAPVSTLDLDTPTGAEIPIEERDPAELTAAAAAPMRSTRRSMYTAELVTAMFTEVGALEPPYLESIASAVRG